MGREDRVRRLMLKSINKNHELSPTEIDSTTQTETSDLEHQNSEKPTKSIKVIDRFALIL